MVPDQTSPQILVPELKTIITCRNLETTSCNKLSTDGEPRYCLLSLTHSEVNRIPRLVVTRSLWGNTFRWSSPGRLLNLRLSCLAMSGSATTTHTSDPNQNLNIGPYSACRSCTMTGTLLMTILYRFPMIGHPIGPVRTSWISQWDWLCESRCNPPKLNITVWEQVQSSHHEMQFSWYKCRNDIFWIRCTPYGIWYEFYMLLVVVCGLQTTGLDIQSSQMFDWVHVTCWHVKLVMKFALMIAFVEIGTSKAAASAWSNVLNFRVGIFITPMHTHCLLQLGTTTRSRYVETSSWDRLFPTNTLVLMTELDHRMFGGDK